MQKTSVFLPYEQFVDSFLHAPTRDLDGDPLRREHETAMPDFDKVTEATAPAEKYQQLLAIINQHCFLPGDIAIANQALVREHSLATTGVYRRSEVEQVFGGMQWAYVELLIEFKTIDTGDPFSQRDEMAKDLFERILWNATFVFNSQHRTHLFTILIFGAMARFIRWDRAGYVVSEPFDYVSAPWKLTLFLWRFARVSPEQRGHDKTATRILPGSPEYELIRERAMPPKPAADGETVVPGDHARTLFENSVRDSMLWRLRVDDTKKGPQYFLIGKPHYRTPGLAGRGTQTFVAIDEADPYGPFVYLKDAWRVAHTGIEQEGKILERLNSEDDGGPVPTYRLSAVTAMSRTRLDEECPLKTHRHYRLVVNEVGKPLSEFKNMEELVGLILLSISAHGEAYERKGLIHRDISAGNIVICPQLVRNEDGTVEEIATPLLADWELAKRVNDPDEKARQPDRTGTWQFMSASTLARPAKRILVQDDMESFFHLLVYYAIRFLPHNCPDVRRFMDLYLDGHEDLNGALYGGEKKLNTMVLGKLTIPGGAPLCFHLPRQDPPDPKSPTEIIPCPECAPPPPTGDGDPKAPLPLTSSRCSKKEEPSVPHPINILLKEFLCRLRAHYVLYVERKSKTSSKPSALSEEKLRKKLTQGLGLGVKALASKHKLTFSLKPDTVPELTPLTPDAKAKLEVLAAELGDHTAMRQLFYNHWVGEWPSHDRCKDQLPSNYRPRAIDNTGRKDADSKKRGADSTWDTSDDHSVKRSHASTRS